MPYSWIVISQQSNNYIIQDPFLQLQPLKRGMWKKCTRQQLNMEYLKKCICLFLQKFQILHFSKQKTYSHLVDWKTYSCVVMISCV